MGERVQQHQCCDAVLRIIEVRLRCRRSNVSIPDSRNRSDEEVDLCATVAAAKYAIEHTLIEPMEGFVESGYHFVNFVNGFDQLIAGQVPPDKAFLLSIPVPALMGLSKKNISAIRQALAKFTVEKMPTLGQRPPKKLEIPPCIADAMFDAAQNGDDDAFAIAYAKLEDLRSRRYPAVSINTMPEGVPFRVALTVVKRPRPSKLGTLEVVRSVGADLERERVTRVARALRHKDKRLRQYKDEGFHPVLILESEDLALTNDDLVFEALSAALLKNSVSAEEVYFVDTSTTTYAFRQFVIGGKTNDRWFSEWDEFEAEDLAASEAEITESRL